MSFAGPASADIRNYTVGKGKAYFKRTGASVTRDLGNATVFEFTPAIEKLDHFTSRNGVKQKDRSVTLSTEGELKITLEEFTVENMALALMGTVDEDSTGRPTIDILAETEIAGEVKFTMTNDIGQKFEFVFNNVSFTPSSTLSPLSDEWGAIEITGQVLADGNGKFGTATHIGGEGYDEVSSS